MKCKDCRRKTETRNCKICFIRKDPVQIGIDADHTETCLTGYAVLCIGHHAAQKLFVVITLQRTVVGDQQVRQFYVGSPVP